jgi:hypothetical protein
MTLAEKLGEFHIWHNYISKVTDWELNGSLMSGSYKNLRSDRNTINDLNTQSSELRVFISLCNKILAAAAV